MNEMGFAMLLSDECVFRRESVWILIYVGDIILIGPDEKDICAVKKEIRSHVDVKDLGVLRSFLGVVFVQDTEGVWLSQCHYILSVIKRFGMSSCKELSTPMGEGALKDIAESQSPATEREKYQELLRCLLFLSTRTRLDIKASVGILCRYSSNPKQVHWVALKRILRYLNGTKDHALNIFRSDEPVLSAFCDADWASDCADRK